MLTFSVGRCFESHVLLIRVTSQPISRQVVELGSESGGRYSKVRVIKVVAYVQPLNASPESKNWCTALEAMTEMGESLSRKRR